MTDDPDTLIPNLPPSAAAGSRRQVLLVTGMSGAGLSVALKAL